MADGAAKARSAATGATRARARATDKSEASGQSGLGNSNGTGRPVPSYG
jgi:hypothetical protein